jgi:hypothetical protein
MDVVVGTCTTVLQYANFSIQQLETFHHLALTNRITPSRAFLSTILVTSSMFGENEFSSMFSGRVKLDLVVVSVPFSYFFRTQTMSEGCATTCDFTQCH